MAAGAPRLLTLPCPLGITFAAQAPVHDLYPPALLRLSGP